VLRELFAALDNDPYVIAECLARPVLVERSLTNPPTRDQESLKSLGTGEAQGQMPKVMATGSPNYVLPAISGQPDDCNDSWTATSTTNTPSPRTSHTAVWTGSEILMRRYASVPMSLADSCLVRMSEIYPECNVFTLDSDFGIYRRNGRQMIPLITPERYNPKQVVRWPRAISSPN
jgi:hypothetical protein